MTDLMEEQGGTALALVAAVAVQMAVLGGLVAFQIFKTTELVVQVVQVARLRSRSAATTTIRKNCPAATERRDSRVPI